MKILVFAAMLVSLLLGGCSAPPDEARLEPQRWGKVIFEVESRPAPVRVGMNEFLVIATEERGRPVHDLIVSMRASDEQKWHQAIQDGLSGVYRRAIRVPSDARALTLLVQRKRSDEETELVFPFELKR